MIKEVKIIEANFIYLMMNDGQTDLMMSEKWADVVD